MVVAVAALTAVVTSGVAFAAGQALTDVPDEHPFAEEIAAITEAGIMAPDADGAFDPDGTVSRGAMAAFLSRGLGRAGADEGTASDTEDREEQALAEVEVTAGAASPGTGGYVLLTGTVSGSFLATDCPCHVRSELLDVTENTEAAQNINAVGDTPTLVTAAFGSVTSTWVFPIAGGQTKVFRLNGSTYVEGASLGELSGQLTALYVPFPATGTQAGDAESALVTGSTTGTEAQDDPGDD